MNQVLSKKTKAIRNLNDRLRQSHQGGRVLLSRGIADLGAEAVVSILAKVACFERFNGDNDPYGEHDCAILDYEGQRIMFKIDYYDPTMQFLSDDPSDAGKTARVMTVLLASEY